MRDGKIKLGKKTWTLHFVVCFVEQHPEPDLNSDGDDSD